MRLIGTIQSKKQAEEFSYYLAKQGILNQCEVHVNSDWGSSNYGDTSCNIWIYDEDQIDKATEALNAFNDNPDDPKYRHHASFIEVLKPQENEVKPEIEVVQDQPTGRKAPWEPSIGRATLGIMLICIWIFIWGMMNMPPLPQTASNPELLGIIAQPEINKVLEYDYPHAFEIIDRLVTLYGPEKVANPAQLPSEGTFYYDRFLHTSYWKGIYALIVTKGADEQQLLQAPLFEKVRQGEVWRLFTPCLLHANVIHILFNLLWFMILGKLIEFRLGIGRYLLLILAVGIFSNTAQYLMSGAEFLGISGVLCGMIAFIWMRQRCAAWEGYELQPGTFAFFMFFILTMAGIQLLSFVLEMYYATSLSVGIANTAHLSGALAGFILGRLKFFSWKAS